MKRFHHLLALAVLPLSLAGCGGVLPFPYPQQVPIPEFTGKLGKPTDREATMEVRGHPETRAAVSKNGRFRTVEGIDSIFGRDQFYSSRSYWLQVSISGKSLGTWQVKRPGLLGYYPGQPNHGKGIDVGQLD